MSKENEYPVEEYPKVRALKLKDRKILSSLIKKFAEKSDNSKIMELVPSAGKPQENKTEENETEENEVLSPELYNTIKSVLTSLIEWVDEDVSEWFMDLIGVKSIEEYENLPMDIEIYIIEALCRQKGFKNFFLKASELFKKMRG